MTLDPLIEQAKRTKILHLGYLSLQAIPKPVFSQLTSLIRLDLGCNLLGELGPEIRALTGLEQLWLNDNPLRQVHPNIQYLKRLQVLDLRGTLLKTLPIEMGRLKRLHEVDLRETPMEGGIGSWSTEALIQFLALQDKRDILRVEIHDKLCTGLYREVTNTALGQETIPVLVQAVCDMFTDVQDLKQVLNNCDRLFPQDLQKVAATSSERAAQQLHEKFVLLRRENQMKKLSAELELKLCALYYDRFDPAKMEGYIRSIYEKVRLLEDIQFLIKHAAEVMPPNAEEITGEGVRDSMLKLQGELCAAKEACAKMLLTSLQSIYTDREPVQVKLLTEKVTSAFVRGRFITSNEVEQLKKLAADASMLFPAEFPAADPLAVRKAFRQREAEAAALLA